MLLPIYYAVLVIISGSSQCNVLLAVSCNNPDNKLIKHWFIT